MAAAFAPVEVRVQETESFQSLDDWLPWLETLSPREIVLGLERVHEVLARLALSRPRLVIHVAGTNGKGSCAAMLEAVLQAGGMRTGCYTSPHLVHYNERIRINGAPASDDAIVTALRRVESVRDGVPLTFFEFGTLAALVAFDSAGVDAWILEVGMGGRLDAVNAVEPDASLITSVALDHCAWLGDDVESIAREKAGIMRRDKPAIFGAANVPAAIHEHAREVGAQLLLAGRDFACEKGPANSWDWRGSRHELTGLQRPALAGDIQMDNAAAVLAVVEALGLERLLRVATVDSALAQVALEGRFQIINGRWILDVAHNPAAARVLASQLGRLPGRPRVTAITGMLADKDIGGFLEPLCEFVDRWIAVPLTSPRAESAGKVAQEIANLCGRPCLIAGAVDEACDFAETHTGEGDFILVTGSFFVVGPVLEWLRKK